MSRRFFAGRWVLFWVGVLVVLGWLRFRSVQPEGLPPGIYQVEYVVDGDTLRLTNRSYVRLIGADTPETVHPRIPDQPWGAAATEFTEEFVAGGRVRLQFDGRRQDRHGRYLAHVWVGDRMLGEELIRRGLAKAETKYSYSQEMKGRFTRAENEARDARRGIWSGGPPPE
jgi:micrococcal nuclease